MELTLSEIVALGTEILRRGELLRFSAGGESMYPSIRDGDVLTIKPVHPSLLRVGEVVFCKTASQAVAHRLVWAKRNGRGFFLLQGDRNMRPDPPVRADQIMGRVVELSRDGRIIRLDRPGRRLVGLAVAASSPIRPILYPVLRRAVGWLFRGPKLLPVEEVLLLLCRTDLTSREMDQIGKRLGQVDWDKLMLKATLHGVAPTVYLHLRRLRQPLPGDVRARLRHLYISNLLHNLRLKARLEEVVSLLNTKGVWPIPLKGVFWAEHLHGDIGLRPSSDIDLLVRRADLPLVMREVRRAGYEPLSQYPEKFIHELLRHQAFVRRDSPLDGVCLEIHWSFFPRLLREFDMSRVWRDSIPTRVGDLRILTLSPEHTLLYLAIALKLHAYIGLKLFADVCRFLRVEKRIEWDRLVEEAEENGQRVGLYYALKFARDLLGAVVPGKVLIELCPSLLQRLLVPLVLNRRTVLRPVRKRLRRAYWDLVRLVTADDPLAMMATLGRALLFHPEEVWARQQIF